MRVTVRCLAAALVLISMDPAHAQPPKEIPRIDVLWESTIASVTVQSAVTRWACADAREPARESPSLVKRSANPTNMPRDHSARVQGRGLKPSIGPAMK